MKMNKIIIIEGLCNTSSIHDFQIMIAINKKNSFFNNKI